ncbi:DUF6220 domain-containing protein [Dactylosporangium darangshiense]|uniref:Integral membrane protein n=1 Tax=Dactylosporangium darangshiense TaxID=579108 RepID=A0ABP8DPY4_9ACTN
MRKAFAGLAALFLLAVVVQFFLAASGAFNTAPNDESFRPHRTLGYVIFLLAVVLVIVAALARMSGRLIGMAGLVAGLVVVQVLIAALARAFDTGDITTTAGQLIFGLHAVNGLAIVAVSARILRQARALASRPVAGPAPTAS